LAHRERARDEKATALDQLRGLGPRSARGLSILAVNRTASFESKASIMPHGGARAVERLEAALAHHQGALVLVTHDDTCSHTSILQLRAAVATYVDAHNEGGKPFKRTKTADEILGSRGGTSDDGRLSSTAASASPWRTPSRT
jgi:hypothetical protein